MQSLEDSQQIIECFPIELRRNINKLWIAKNNISFAPENIKITPILDGTECYEFILHLPYAGKFLDWRVLFLPDDVAFAPDFDFTDGFLEKCEVDFSSEHMPSMVEWDINNPTSLVKIIAQFRNHYRKWQIEKFRSDNRLTQLYTEYITLTNQTDFTEENFEIYINPGTVNLTVKFSLEYSLPFEDNFNSETLTPDTICEYIARLEMVFDGTSMRPELFLSPHLEHILSEHMKLHIPKYTKEISLGDYIVGIKQMLKDHLDEITNSFKLRRDYINTILIAHSTSIIEYDTQHFSKITLLFKMGDFQFLIAAKIGFNFPQEKPSVVLRSIYHMQFGRPVTEPVNDYPYDPQWSPEEMVNRLTDYLIEYAPTFKTNCLTRSQNFS